MTRRTAIWPALATVLIGLLIPIVPRQVVPIIRPYPYDDPYVGAGIVRIGPLLLWNALPFALLATVACVWLTRPAQSGRQRAVVLGGVAGAMVPGLVVGLWVHTPDPETVGANLGAALFPLYMVVLMPAGFGLGALLGRLLGGRGAASHPRPLGE